MQLTPSDNATQAKTLRGKAVFGFFSGIGFPTFTLSALFFIEAAVLTLLLVPPGDSGLAAFAEDFRVYCFGYDPAGPGVSASGSASSFFGGAIAVTLTQSVLLACTVAFVWWRPLKEAWASSKKRLLPYAGVALLLVLSGGAAFAWARGPSQKDLPFPAQRLRMQRTPPPLALVDHEGKPISLSEHRGKVVMITAVYARCGQSCPTIMGQAKRVVAALSESEREKLAVLAVSLDPEHDTPQVLANLATAQGVHAPLFHLLSGEPSVVNRVLDSLEVYRQRNPKTGIIDHANIFLLIDRRGRLAYRLSLGERQERWLLSALRLLTAE